MNYRIVVRHFGLLLIVLSGSMLLTELTGLLLQHGQVEISIPAQRAMVMAITAGMALGGLLWWRFSESKHTFFGRREALLLVAISWLGGAVVAAIPFWLWAMMSPAAPPDHPFHSFVDCYFEAMSGLTTTGASVLTDIEAIPKSLLLWRAVTHWLGGLGIVVLFVAVLPTLGVGGKKMFQVEATGPSSPGVRPKIRETARLLWMIYVGLTIAEAVILRLAGLSWFDAICHTFATLATGGFSTLNASVGQMRSPTVDWIIIVFMLLAGVNFGLYYHLLRRRWRTLVNDPELRLYLAIIGTSTVIITLTILPKAIIITTGEMIAPSIGEAIRFALFQVVSVQTTTGFATADYEQWGPIPKLVLFILMFVGASAGSTGGGIKVIRFYIAFKVMIAEVERVFRPNVVRSVRVGHGIVDPELRLATMVYLLGIMGLFALGTAILVVCEPELDFVTLATASAATLHNIGPGFGLVGPTDNFGFFSAPSKLVMSVLMALGRLEVYAILVLFMSRFWHGE